MKILIAGGAGYLGSHVTRYLASRAKVTVLDSLLYRDEYYESVDFIRGEISDPKDFTYDAILWLAAIVGDMACNTNPAMAFEINTESVKRIAGEFSGPLIFISTASVYGYYEGVATEDTPFNPQSIYAETKVRAEQELKGRPNTLVLRLATLHGLSPRMRFDLGVNVMTRDAVTKGVVTVYGGDQWRPWAAVRDVAHFIQCQATKEPMLTGTYNVVSENLTVNQIADTVCRITGAERETIATMEDQRDYRMSGEKLGVAYRPVITVEDTVGEIARALDEGRIKNPYANRYINSKVMQGRMLE